MDETRKEHMRILMEEGKIMNNDMYHYLTKQWMQDFLKRRGIAFRTRDSKEQLWEIIRKNTGFAPAKKPTLFWGKLGAPPPSKIVSPPGPKTSAGRRGTPQKEKGENKTCNQVVEQVLADWQKEGGPLPSLEDLQIDVEYHLVQSEPEIVQNMAMEILESLRKQEKKEVFVAKPAEVIVPKVSFLEPVPSTSKKPSPIKKLSPTKKVVTSKEEEFELEEDEGEFFAAQREVQAKLDEIYETALAEFNKLANPTDTDHTEFVNEVVEDIDAALEDIGQSPGKEYLMRLAEDILSEEWGYSQEDVDTAVTDWEETLMRARIAEQERRFQALPQMSAEESRFYEELQVIVDQTTAANVEPVVRFINNYRASHSDFKPDRAELRLMLDGQNLPVKRIFKRIGLIKA